MGHRYGLKKEYMRIQSNAENMGWSRGWSPWLGPSEFVLALHMGCLLYLGGKHALRRGRSPLMRPRYFGTRDEPRKCELNRVV